MGDTNVCYLLHFKSINMEFIFEGHIKDDHKKKALSIIKKHIEKNPTQSSGHLAKRQSWDKVFSFNYQTFGMNKITISRITLRDTKLARAVEKGSVEANSAGTVFNKVGYEEKIKGYRKFEEKFEEFADF